MKRFVWAILCGVLGAFIFISIAAAAPTTSCGQNNNNQLIMLLSSDNNAHGSEWNASDYTTEICYNKLFGSNYNGPSPHRCSVNNLVLRLSGITNAHAESNSLNNYGTKVCYGNLVCTTRTTTCSAGEKEIVSLSSQTNAHLETNDSDFYVNRICCSLGGGGTAGGSNFTLVQWQNSAGQPIGVSYNAMTHVNWTVRLVAFTKFPAGTSITFEVWDKDLLLDDFIRSFTALT